MSAPLGGPARPCAMPSPALERKHPACPSHTAASLVQALTKAPPAPAGPPCVQFEQFWVEAGPLGQPREASAGFVATPSVRSHLRNLARAVQLRKHPILLQVSSLHGSPAGCLFCPSGNPFVYLFHVQQSV